MSRGWAAAFWCDVGLTPAVDLASPSNFPPGWRRTYGRSVRTAVAYVFVLASPNLESKWIKFLNLCNTPGFFPYAWEDEASQLLVVKHGEAMPKTSAEGYGLMVKSVKTPAIPIFCGLFLQCSGCCRYCMLRRYVWCLDFGNPMLRRWRFRMAFPGLLYPNLDWMGLTNGVNVEDMGTPNETNWWGM